MFLDLIYNLLAIFLSFSSPLFFLFSPSLPLSSSNLFHHRMDCIAWQKNITHSKWERIGKIGRRTIDFGSADTKRGNVKKWMPIKGNLLTHQIQLVLLSSIDAKFHIKWWECDYNATLMMMRWMGHISDEKLNANNNKRKKNIKNY